MPATYITHDRDRLDRIARRAYGTEHAGNVEKILEANPGLAERPIDLPSGVAISLPDPPANDKIIQTVKLWD